MNGKRTVYAPDTEDRKTADGKLSTWLADLKKVDPGNHDDEPTINPLPSTPHFAPIHSRSPIHCGPWRTVCVAVPCCTPKTVETRLYRARQSLRETLACRLKQVRGKKLEGFHPRWRIKDSHQKSRAVCHPDSIPQKQHSERHPHQLCASHRHSHRGVLRVAGALEPLRAGGNAGGEGRAAVLRGTRLLQSPSRTREGSEAMPANAAGVL